MTNDRGFFEMYAAAIRAQWEAAKRAANEPGFTPRDCDFCERKGVRCVALDHRLIAREDTRGEVEVEPAWICIDCIRERTKSA